MLVVPAPAAVLVLQEHGHVPHVAVGGRQGEVGDDRPVGAAPAERGLAPTDRSPLKVAEVDGQHTTWGERLGQRRQRPSDGRGVVEVVEGMAHPDHGVDRGEGVVGQGDPSDLCDGRRPAALGRPRAWPPRRRWPPPCGRRPPGPGSTGPSRSRSRGPRRGEPPRGPAGRRCPGHRPRRGSRSPGGAPGRGRGGSRGPAAPGHGRARAPGPAVPPGPIRSRPARRACGRRRPGRSTGGPRPPRGGPPCSAPARRTTGRGRRAP